ncbi:MAG TPA: extracellular solute-binding protein [Herbaspirillum sp.]|jgi:iron(III) transport system substrate-binding protein
MLKITGLFEGCSDRTARVPARRVARKLAIAACGLFCVSGLVLAQAPTPQAKAAIANLMMYKGADRDQRLLEGARKEGTISMYTSLNPKDSGPLTEAFQKKYGVKVSVWRASGEKMTERAITEARAGRFTPDVMESDGVEMEILAREHLLQEFYSPSFKDLPAAAFTKQRLYVADRFNFFTIAYNTNLVKPEDVPNSYQDLVLPKWKGKIGLEADDSDWFAALVKVMGEDKGLAFFKKLQENKPQMRKGHTLMAELVAAGEIPIAAALYNHGVERLALSGAPIKWKALAPTLGRPGAIAVSSNPPHPYGALLFADFVLSREGQELIKSRHRVPASTAVDTTLNKFPFLMIDPAITLDESVKWEKLWNDMFIGQAKL